MKKARKALFLTILVVIPLFTSCFLFDFLSPQTTSSRSKMVMTVTPQSPTYVGENMVVRISTSPSRRQEFIRLTITNLITGTSQVLEENEVSSAEFTFAAPASNFTVMAEIPGYEKRLGKEKDKSWSGLQDFTPPNVTLSVQREDPTKNIFLVEVSVDEPHSTITSVGYSLDGQTRSLDLSRVGARGVASAQVPMEIGQHVFQGFATNQSQKKGYSQNTYLEVAPPFSTNPPQIQLLSPSESEPFIDCFQDEMVTISANISDGTSYLEEVRVFSDAGIRRIFEFDPLQKEYFLNYRFRVSESQTVQIIAINGNGIEEDETVWVDMINHRAPQITLSGPEGETPAGTPLTYNFTVTAQDGVNLSEVYFLADNSTVRSFQSIGEPSFSGSVRYTVPKKDHFLKVVAIDEMGARGESDEIQITGIVEDNDPPEIQLFFPSVAYQGFDTDLGFTCRDTGSGLDGNPSIVIGKTGETGNTIIPMTFDNQFFYTNWTPGSTGTYSCKVSAVDKAGNQAVRESIIEVKDPTGVLLPTVLNLGAFPDPVMIGNNVQINITIVPPAQGGGVTPIVQFEVTSPASANYSISPITQTGNVHSAIFTPFDEGLHSVFAHVQWGETSFTKNCTFRVLSPEPASDFTVYPTETYLGNMVTLSLNPYSSNPNANITVQSMTFAGRPLSWSIQSNPTTGLQMYVATTTTENNATGTNLARVQYTDNFGNVKNEEAPVLLKTPVVSITGFNITPRIGSQPQAYTPIYFEVTLDKNTIPSGIVPSGEITISELGDTPRAQVTVPLVQDASETNVLRSQRDWLPPKEGTYSLVANTSLQVGAFTFSDREEEIVEVFPAAIDITLDSSPVSLERITVGRQIDLEYSVFGIPASDTVHSFQYAIYHGGNIHVAQRTLEEDSPGRYSDKLDPFMEAGSYEIIATVTTIAPAVKTKTWDFSVLPAEIRKKVFKLDGVSQNLVFGQPINFILELENPNNNPKLGIKMFLVDQNHERIPNIDPIVALPENAENTTFRNETPFFLYQEATFTAAASITIEEVPQIDLPTEYADSWYHMYAPTTELIIDGSRKYYRGYSGSIDVTVTKPSSMEIQDPVLSLVTPGQGTLEPTPYSSSSSSPNYIQYRYRITPQVTGNISVRGRLFEKEDINFQNPVAEATQTLVVEEFEPRVVITGAEGENEFIQAKAPAVLLEISEVPEFFEGTYKFIARLDGNPATNSPLTTTDPNASVTFFSNHLFNKLGADAVEISASVEAEGNEVFSAQGTKSFDVRLPSISNTRFPDYVLNKNYHAYDESTMVVLFNNNDRVIENLRIDLFIFNPSTESTETFNSNSILSSSNVGASAQFSGIVFPKDVGDFRVVAKVFGTNNQPNIQLDASSFATVSVINVLSSVDIMYPYSGQKIPIFERIRPKAVLKNFPNVLSVTYDIIDSTGATIVSNGRADLNANGQWEMKEIDAVSISNLGVSTVTVRAISSDLGDEEKSVNFTVFPGEFSEKASVNKIGGGSLIFPGEEVLFESKFTFSNLNVHPLISASAVPLPTGSPFAVVQISESISTSTSGVQEFTHKWGANGENAPLPPGAYRLDFMSAFMGESCEGSTTFTVVSKVNWPEISVSNTTPTENSLFEAEVMFDIPPNVYQHILTLPSTEATLSNLFTCQFSIGNLKSEPFSSIIMDDSSGSVYYYKGVRATIPEDFGSFVATATPTIDGEPGPESSVPITVIE